LLNSLPHNEVQYFSDRSFRIISSILVSLGVEEEECEVDKDILVEVAEFFLRDIYRIDKQQRGSVSIAKWAGYWAFWVRKLKPISMINLDEGEEYASLTREDAVHINEIVALQFSLEIVAKYRESGGLEANKASETFDGVFIFGSLIHRNGRHFVPQGSLASDVDLILTFRDELTDAISRTRALVALRAVVQSLEQTTATVLKRVTREEIYSLLPITSYEIHQCIHKGHDPKLFTANLFLNVDTGEQVDGGLANYVDYDYHFENLEAFSAIRLCQSFPERDYARSRLTGVL